MRCYVYKGDRHDDHYLFLASAIEPGTDADIPTALLSLLGELSLVIDFELTPERRLPQADVQQVIEDIEKHGFYLQMPKKDLQAEEDYYFN